MHELASSGGAWSHEHRVESPRMVIAQTGALALRQGKQKLLGQAIQKLTIDDSAPYTMRSHGAGSTRSWVLIPLQNSLRTHCQLLPLQQWLSLARSSRLAAHGECLALEECCVALLADSQTDLSMAALKSQKHKHIVASVREYLSLHVQERLPLAQIAQAVNVSAFHLIRLFKQGAGITIHQAQMHLRIVHAVYRLEQGQVDLTQLALDIGFSSHSHFSAVFRQLVGCTPSDWRYQRKTR